MASLPTVPSLTSLRNSPPSTLAWRFHARHAGSHLTTVAPPSASPQSSSPSPVQGHGTSPCALASLPSQQDSRLNTTTASTATHNVMAATGLAITPYAVPTRPTVAGVLGPTLRGTTPVPPPPAPRRAAPVHTPLLSVSHAPALTKHILPSAPTVLPPSPARRVGRMMRCASTGGLPPPLLLTFGGCYSYSVARKGGLVLSQACYALHDGGGPTSEFLQRVRDFIVSHTGSGPLCYNSLVSLVRLRVDSSCFFHLGFQYAIALVSCMRRVVPNNTTPYDFKKKKKKHSADRHATQPLFTSPKVFNTTLPAKPFSHWPKTLFTPLRLEENIFTCHDGPQDPQKYHPRPLCQPLSGVGRGLP